MEIRPGSQDVAIQVVEVDLGKQADRTQRIA